MYFYGVLLSLKLLSKPLHKCSSLANTRFWKCYWWCWGFLSKNFPGHTITNVNYSLQTASLLPIKSRFNKKITHVCMACHHQVPVKCNISDILKYFERKKTISSNYKWQSKKCFQCVAFKYLVPVLSGSYQKLLLNPTKLLIGLH